MLTLYQLKQNRCFRCCYKAPYYIKNTVLMIILSFLLFWFNIVFFRADGGSLKVALNLIKGLNSNTFNYLQGHSVARMKVDQPLRVFDAANEEVTSQMFFSSCVKFNRPCKLQGLASKWQAVKKWNSGL